MSRVLVVEKHRVLRSTLSKLLEGMGIEPIEASNIDEIYTHDIDLVITDAISSRGLSDIGVPVIVITPNAEHGKENVHYIRQPFEVRELCEAVKKLTKQYVG